MRSRASTVRGWCAAGAIAVGLAAGGLSGCGAPPHPLDSASPTSTPTESPTGPAFASPEAAFEAAVATYQRYMDLWNQIASEGGADPERLLEVLVDNDYATEEIAAFNEFAANGVHVQGAIEFRSPQLVQYQAGARLIQTYVCSEVTNARIIDREGQDITPERANELPLMITFTVTDDDSILLKDSEQWDAPGIC